jgi:imidazolonepropionase
VSDLNIVRATQVARLTDRGAARRGPEQRELDLLADGAVAIRGGLIAAVGTTDEVLENWDDGSPTLDASGMTVLPGLIECHSHPLFAGSRHAEYQLRLAGASLAEIASAGGGIWSTVLATRAATDDDLLAALSSAYERILASGVTTLEVKSGYGLTAEHELHQLELLDGSRALTPLSLVVSFLGAHVVPSGIDATPTRQRSSRRCPPYASRGSPRSTTSRARRACSPPSRPAACSRHRAHADAWASSRGWETAVSGGAVSAEHLTYTPDDEIQAVGATDTIAVLLPQAELVYMTERRANARLLIEQEVPVAVATDYCSSIHATSLTMTLGVAAPWFRMTAAEVIVGATLNAACALRLQSDRGSIEPGKRGDLTVLAVERPNELTLAVGQNVVSSVIVGGETVHGRRPKAPTE